MTKTDKTKADDQTTQQGAQEISDDDLEHVDGAGIPFIGAPLGAMLNAVGSVVKTGEDAADKATGGSKDKDDGDKNSSSSAIYSAARTVRGY